jgi:hypothetical protein
VLPVLGTCPLRRPGFDPQSAERGYGEVMSKPTTLSLSITGSSNGLYIVTLFEVDRSERRYVARAAFTVDPEEGWPRASEVLRRAVEAVSGSLG